MFKTSFIVIALISCILADEDDGAMENDDKLILKPADLADLVLKELIKTELTKAASYKKHPKYKHDNSVAILSADDIDFPIPNYKIEESDDDAETLKNRKIWSRWSKWGECSVSCGSGFMTRQRACVAGRCARGEREEQRRPCRRTPCPTNTNDPE